MKQYSYDEFEKLFLSPSFLRNVSLIVNSSVKRREMVQVLQKGSGTEVLPHVVHRSRPDDDPPPIIEPFYTSFVYEVGEDLAEQHSFESKEVVVNLLNSYDSLESTLPIGDLYLTDGVIIVIDAFEGLTTAAEDSLRRALLLRVRPVFIIDNFESAIAEKSLSKEALYSTFVAALEKVNRTISLFNDGSFGVCLADPQRGNVAFASLSGGWAFTLESFAAKYAQKFNVNKEKLMARLWGDNFYNPATKDSERGFCKYILDPIFKIFDSALNGHRDELKMIASKLEIRFFELSGKDLLSNIMNQFLPASSILEMLCIRLPPPIEAQKYRCEVLYSGPMDDECATAIKNCDRNGPLMIYASRMVPSHVEGRYFAIGRVFSGTAEFGMKVNILGPSYRMGQTDDILSGKFMRRLLLISAGKIELIESCPAGTMVGIFGFDLYLASYGTITNYQSSYSFKTTIKDIGYPLIGAQIKAIHPEDNASLAKAIMLLPSYSRAKLDSTRLLIYSSINELHFQRLMRDLKNKYSSVSFDVSEPQIFYRETVRRTTGDSVTVTSSNGDISITLSVSSLVENFMLRSGRIPNLSNSESCAKYLIEVHGWDPRVAKNVWEFSPYGCDPNILMNFYSGGSEFALKGFICEAFRECIKESVLAGLPLTGCRFDLIDAKIKSNPNFNRGEEVLSLAKQCMRSAILAAEPALMEPISLVDVYCASDCSKNIIEALTQRGGYNFEVKPIHGLTAVSIRAHLPFEKAFNLTDDMKKVTFGQCLVDYGFDHLKIVDDEERAASLMKVAKESTGRNELLDQFTFY